MHLDDGLAGQDHKFTYGTVQLPDSNRMHRYARTLYRIKGIEWAGDRRAA